MNETRKLIRDIEAEQDDLLDVDYNPLKHALSSDTDSKNDIFARVDHCLTDVIDASFKGFSSSVFTYNAISSANQNCLDDIEKIKFYIDSVKKTVDVDIKKIERLKHELSVQDQVVRILGEIEHIIRLISGSESNLKQTILNHQNLQVNIHKKAEDLVRAEKLCWSIGNLSFISDLKVLIFKEKEDLLNRICEDICAFIFYDDYKGAQSIRTLSILNGYEHAVNIFEEMLPKKMSEQVEKSIFLALKESSAMQNCNHPKIDFMELFTSNSEQVFNPVIFSTESTFESFDSSLSSNDDRNTTLPRFLRENGLSREKQDAKADLGLEQDFVHTSQDSINCVFQTWKKAIEMEFFAPTQRLIAQNIGNFFRSMLQNYLSVHSKIQSHSEQTKKFIERDVGPKILESPQIFYQIAVDSLKALIDRKDNRQTSNTGFSLDFVDENINIEYILGDLSLESKIHNHLILDEDLEGHEFDCHFDFEAIYLLYLSLPDNFANKFYEFIEEKFTHKKYLVLRKKISSISRVHLETILQNKRFLIVPVVLNLLYGFRWFHELKNSMNLFISLINQVVAVFYDSCNDEFSHKIFKEMVFDNRSLKKSSGFDFFEFGNVANSENFSTPSNKPYDSSFSPMLIGERYQIPTNDFSSNVSHIQGSKDNINDQESKTSKSLYSQKTSNICEENKSIHTDIQKSTRIGTSLLTDSKNSFHELQTKIPDAMRPSLKKMYGNFKRQRNDTIQNTKHSFNENHPVYQQLLSMLLKTPFSGEIIFEDAKKLAFHASLFYSLYDLVQIFGFEKKNFMREGRDVFADSKISELSSLLNKVYIAINIGFILSVNYHFDHIIRDQSKFQRSRSLRNIMSIFRRSKDTGIFRIVSLRLLSHSLSEILSDCEDYMFVKDIDDLYDLLRYLYMINDFILENTGDEVSFITSNICYFEDILQDRCDTAKKIGLRKRLILNN